MTINLSPDMVRTGIDALEMMLHIMEMAHEDDTEEYADRCELLDIFYEMRSADLLRRIDEGRDRYAS